MITQISEYKSIYYNCINKKFKKLNDELTIDDPKEFYIYECKKLDEKDKELLTKYNIDYSDYDHYYILLNNQEVKLNNQFKKKDNIQYNVFSLLFNKSLNKSIDRYILNTVSQITDIVELTITLVKAKNAKFKNYTIQLVNKIEYTKLKDIFKNNQSSEEFKIRKIKNIDDKDLELLKKYNSNNKIEKIKELGHYYEIQEFLNLNSHITTLFNYNLNLQIDKYIEYLKKELKLLNEEFDLNKVIFSIKREDKSFIDKKQNKTINYTDYILIPIGNKRFKNKFIYKF